MKRIFTLVMLIVLVFTMTGCKSKPVDNTADDTANDIATHTIAKAEYPKMTQNPHTDMALNGGDFTAWRDDVNRQLEYHYDGLNIDGFIKNSTAKLLSSEGDNKVYSPLNIYIALSMLAEITEGDTRGQVLEALGVDNIETLRDNVTRLWNSTYIDDGELTTILANSLWLSDSNDYNEEVLLKLATEYYASSFAGKMGSDEYNKELKSWLNEQTKGFLSNQVNNAQLYADTIIALVSTIYFKGTWQGEFNKELTAEDTFYNKNGETTVDFMNKTEYLDYFDGEEFTAVKKGFNGNSNMYLILPDEDTDINEFASGDAFCDFMIAPKNVLKEQSAYVKLSVPKFDINSEFKLSKTLTELGVTDAFDPAIADYSPIYDGEQSIAISSATHTARVKIDEEGCEAAAYTMIAAGGGTFKEAPEPIEFTLDRPFIFVITSQTGIPLFVGTINQL